VNREELAQQMRDDLTQPKPRTRMIDIERFYVLCAQAVKTYAVVLVSRGEFEDRYREEDLYLKQKQGIPLVYGPFADAGYQNFIPVNDSPFMNDGVEIVTLFEVIG
jgi:hypothetical protein